MQSIDPEADISRLDWLRAGPQSKKPQGFANHIAKVAFLKTLGADRLTFDLPLARLRHYARPMLYRKPAALAHMRAPRRTLELACFLRLQLLRLTDSGLDLLDHRVADLWRGAGARVEEQQDDQLRRYSRLALDFYALVAGDIVAPELLRDRLRSLLPFPPGASPSKAAAIRRELSSDTVRLNATLHGGARASAWICRPTHGWQKHWQRSTASLRSRERDFPRQLISLSARPGHR